MQRLHRSLRKEDLESKGFPFECKNCGNKPLPQQVVDNHGDCEVCGDQIIVYSVDTAEMFIRLGLSSKIN